MRRWLSSCLFAAFAVLLAATLGAQSGSTILAPTPPMGWNSWDSYGLTVTEQQFHANAEVLRDKLKPFGWTYAVVDEGWYMENPEQRPHPGNLQYALDEHGRFLPAPVRFPSAGGAPVKHDGQTRLYSGSEGMMQLARWTHAQGLKFGLHILRGIPKESVRLKLPIEGSPFSAPDAADVAETCPWDPTSYGVRDNAAGQAWYDSLIRQYSHWGVDFLKVDCIADHPYRASEIRQIHDAIAKSGRAMVLSLSPGPTNLQHADEVQRLSQMWRISNDVWDVWSGSGDFPFSVSSQFARIAAWAPHAGPGHWPDADMLPFGMLAPRPDVGPGPRMSRLSLDEEQSQFTLWAISRSPLVLGTNLTMLDAATISLLTNRKVIRVDQTALVSRQVYADERMVVWTADMLNKNHAIAFFNLSEATLPAPSSLHGVQIPRGIPIKDAWTGEILSDSAQFKQLPPHGCAMYLWQN
ncbi:glycoside hydrolase family 27 protein [Terriglobus aquaticus]|uniref:Alpha-galactosidase n=1 Tax=Terriglobus aquaticus TaxID=940139 RepID=A0ABW9KKI6_9BACT|nr:glycoside hydrolase family 27 protein [Terriglobus aquaticus]